MAYNFDEIKDLDKIITLLSTAFLMILVVCLLVKSKSTNSSRVTIYLDSDEEILGCNSDCNKLEEKEDDVNVNGNNEDDSDYNEYDEDDDSDYNEEEEDDDSDYNEEEDNEDYIEETEEDDDEDYI